MICDSLFISRQALRKSVARLAQEMGEPLFENRGNVLFPTAAADLLFSASRPVVSAFAQMEVELNLGPERKISFPGDEYLLTFALPNFFFHVATAHDILRSQGVKIGKMDYLGAAG